MLPQLLLVGVLLGGVIDTDGLSPTQEAELQLQVERMRNSQTPTVDDVKEYAALGHEIGSAIASTAKELGVAAEEFAHTSVGKITIGLIVWKLIGNDLLQAVVGCSFFLVTMTLWAKYFKKLCIVLQTDYYESGKVKSITHQPVNDALHGTRLAMALILAVLIAASMTTIFA